MIVLLIILKIILYLLLFLAGILLLLLLIPFSYSGQLLTADGIRVQLAIAWAWRLLGFRADIEDDDTAITVEVFGRRIYRLKGREAAVEETEEIQHEAEEKPEKPKGRFNLKEMTDKALLHEILEYLKRLLNIAKPKYFHLYGTYGFEDPSVTGMLCGMTSMIGSFIPNARINLIPDFTQEIVEVDIKAEGSMAVGSLAYQTIRTVLKKPVRKIVFKKRKK